MQIDKDKDYIQDFVKLSESIVILCADKGNDTVAAGIALLSYIKETAGKEAVLIYAGDIGKISSSLMSLYDVQTEFEPKILKVTINHKDTTIKTVNYYKESDSRLVLEMSPVERNFDLGKIKYDFSGIDYDLIITVGASKLEDLRTLYQNNKGDFDKSTVVNIDNSSNNENYGKLNIVDSEEDTISSMLFKKFSEWGYVPDKTASKALLAGMSE